MREIKFRALDNEHNTLQSKGKWHYGMPIILTREYDGVIAGTYFPNKGGAIFAYQVNQDTMSQFTGTIDRDGKEIYEGDIVTGKCSDNPNDVCEGIKRSVLLGKQLTGLIRYSNFYAKFYFTTDDITILDLRKGIRDIKIIGNIYENPEILKVV